MIKMEQINEFEKQASRLWKLMGSHSVMVLSTCAQNRVTSRPMSTVIIDGKFYCQTDINYLKCKQLSENPGAALSFKNFSIEGICRIMGKPTEQEFFMRAMKMHFPLAAKRWSSVPTECLLEITPTLVYLWDYENLKPYMEYWDFQSKTYRKEWK